MRPLPLFLVALAGMAAVMAVLFVVAQRRRNAGIVDVAWSFGTGLCAAFFAVAGGACAHRKWLLAGLAAAWAARLGGHLLARVRSEEEDGRYRALREKWGPRAPALLFGFFMLQAAWAVMFAFPVFVAARNPAPLSALDALGAAVWIVGVGGEALADRTLHRFRRAPGNRGKVCRDGLWRYSRHPNYFFEWLHWFSYVLLAAGGRWWFLALFGPAVMLFFLLRVTGVPPTERRALATRGEAYREYQRTTSAFFPWPPKETPPS